MTQLHDIITQTNKTAAQVLSEFTESQRQKWPLASANFSSLEKVEEKCFQFDGFQIKVQYNPERLQSSAAKTDKVSIAARRCFLCVDNLPAEQEGISFGDDFLILVNPFPIFRNHFTVSSIHHTDQRFIQNAESLLRLAEIMKGFTVFYNGPECGASAPDHLHFQAGENEFMPLSEEFHQLKSTGRSLFSGENMQVWAFDHYLRKMISIESDSLTETLKVIRLYYQHFEAMQPEKDEPMMNALCSYTDGKWIVHLFPRKAHRPWQYFAEEKDNFLISPGSVDFGGVFITPRRSDFDKITGSVIADMLTQVCVDQDVFAELANKIKNDLR
ncbi:MAG: DUF4922 domain-containing protein [Prolixibacteraceae bacterium]